MFNRPFVLFFAVLLIFSAVFAQVVITKGDEGLMTKTKVGNYSYQINDKNSVPLLTDTVKNKISKDNLLLDCPGMICDYKIDVTAKQALTLDLSSLKGSVIGKGVTVSSIFYQDLRNVVKQRPVYGKEKQEVCTIDNQTLKQSCGKVDIDVQTGVENYTVVEAFENKDIAKPFAKDEIRTYVIRFEKQNVFSAGGFISNQVVDIYHVIYGQERKDAALWNSSGGTVTYDGNYTVVTFLTNGTFNMTGTIPNATILIVAGGGSGGAWGGGGGGAGGIIYNTSQNLTGNYTVIVGLGGASSGNASANPKGGNSGTNSIFGTMTAIGGGGGSAKGINGKNGVQYVGDDTANIVNITQGNRVVAIMTLLNDVQTINGVKIFTSGVDMFDANIDFTVFAVDQFKIDSKDVGKHTGSTKGTVSFKDTLMLKDVVRNETIPTYITTNTTQSVYNNTTGTYYNVTVPVTTQNGSYTRTWTEQQWITTPDKITLASGTLTTFRQSFHRNDIGDVVDLIPSIAGIDMTNWAWWNVSYTNRQLINCSNVDTGTPIVINGSSGFSLGGQKQIVWTTCQPDLYLYYNNYTSYAVANNTSQVAMDIELGNGTSYLNTTVWLSANAISVWHFNNGIDVLGNNTLIDGTASTTSYSANTTKCKIGSCAQVTVGGYLKTATAKYPTGANPSTMIVWAWRQNATTLSKLHYIYSIGDQEGTNKDRGLFYGNSDNTIDKIAADLYGSNTALINPYNRNNLTTPNMYGLVLTGTTGSVIAGAEGKLLTNSVSMTPNTPANEGLYLGKGAWIGGYLFAYDANVSFDEARLYSDAKSNNYLNQTYQNAISTAGYGTLGTSEASSSITWLNQTPADLSSTSAFTQSAVMTALFNVTGGNGTPTFSYRINSTTRSCNVFVNGTCFTNMVRSGNAVNMTDATLNSVVWAGYADDNDYLPATYNLNPGVMENNTKVLLATLSTANDMWTTEILNFTNDTANEIFETMSNGTSQQDLYYCNSSYAFNAKVTTSPNCYQFNNIPANQPYNHTHNESGNASTYSRHQVVSMPINITSGQMGTVKITPTSYIVIGKPNNAGVVNIYGVNVGSRATTSKTSGNGGTGWSAAATQTADQHVHPFDGSDVFYYWMTANLTGVITNNTIINDTLGVDFSKPTAPRISNPEFGNSSFYVNTGINFTWAASVPDARLSITKYNITIYNATSNLTYLALNTSTTLLYQNWNISGVPTGNYYVVVTAYDNNSQTAFDSELFNIYYYGQLIVNATTGGSATGNNTTFIPSANLTINATPSIGYSFINWTTTCAGTIASATSADTTIEITTDTPCYAQANFAFTPFTVVITNPVSGAFVLNPTPYNVSYILTSGAGLNYTCVLSRNGGVVDTQYLTSGNASYLDNSSQNGELNYSVTCTNVSSQTSAITYNVISSVNVACDAFNDCATPYLTGSILLLNTTSNYVVTYVESKLSATVLQNSTATPISGILYQTSIYGTNAGTYNAIIHFSGTNLTETFTYIIAATPSNGTTVIGGGVSITNEQIVFMVKSFWDFSPVGAKGEGLNMPLGNVVIFGAALAAGILLIRGLLK